jgi:glycosyltransferase involved in cell wall biosynthesis
VYPASQADVHVVYGGVTGHFRPASADAVTAVRNKYRLPDRFILFVGTIEPRKNLTQLLDACRVLKDAGRAMPLVVAGRKGWRSEVFFDRLHQSGLAELTVLTGFVPDEDLPALYSAADVFVFPSLYEGFGLPVLEAMACGTPVITTNVSSLPEVAGPAAILVDPGDCRELAAAVQRLAADPALRREMSVKGTRQAGSFSWEGTARRTLQVYQDALRLKGLDDASDG